MENSVFYSSTYGIGQLITQKKRMEVPLHQRNYSWGSSEVEQFLEDIINAIDENFSNYFLGSLVITPPKDGVWGILDGQQRLTTVSIVYSCIRNILTDLNQVNDATQIANEFLGLRNLGGEYSSRLLLNSENREIYNLAVVNYCSASEIEQLYLNSKGSSSNLLLLNAISQITKILKDWIKDCSHEDSIFRLYKLSSYLETKVLVVSIEVANESDAYTVFETLNTRGQDLSALDLVKNYIFGNAGKENQDIINMYWNEMKSNIGERQADDFLRIFWMGNYGYIQKSRLYPNLKTKFSTQPLTLELAQKLSIESKIYAAIEEPSHELWQNYSPFCRHLIEVMGLLKGKQTRPVIFACLNVKNTVEQIESVLWFLTVLTIRFQTIGKRRQGILEQQCAKIAQSVTKIQLIDYEVISQQIEKIIPNDEEFFQDFKKHQELNMKRALYLMCSINTFYTRKQEYKKIWDQIETLMDVKSNLSVSHILPKHLNFSSDDDNKIDLNFNIANMMLVDSLTNISLRNSAFSEIKTQLSNSKYLTTSELSKYNTWDIENLKNRQDILASLAINIWKIN